MNLTYKQLLQFLQALPAERLEDNVTVHLPEQGEFCPATGFVVQCGDDVLDSGHAYLII